MSIFAVTYHFADAVVFFFNLFTVVSSYNQQDGLSSISIKKTQLNFKVKLFRTGLLACKLMHTFPGSKPGVGSVGLTSAENV